jgi:RNA polymerase-binding transcription factor DksA
MAKKSTNKKSSAKDSKAKNASAKKKAVKVLTKTKAAQLAKKTPKKAVSKKKVVTSKKIEKKNKVEIPKKIVKKKVKADKLEKMEVMPRKKVKTEESVQIEQKPTAAEIRAKAMEKIKGYSKEDLEHFRKIILAKRDEILEQLQNLKEQMLDPTTGEYINENSPYSLHMAEQGTDAMEREKTFLYAQRENKFLGYLEDALKRIDAGTYGICVACIEEPQHLCETCPLIPKARLEAVPHSQLCLPMKQRQEKIK